MAPTKATANINLMAANNLPNMRKTRSKSKDQQNEGATDLMMNLRGKRKADASPLKNDRGIKRSALGNLTNVTSSEQEDGGNNQILKKTNSNLSNKHASQIIQQINNNIANNNNKKATANKIVSEIFTKPSLDGPKTRAATKILTRAASRKQSASSTSASITSATLSVAGTLTKVKSFPPLSIRDENGKEMATTIVKPKEPAFMDIPVPKPKRRISNEFEKTEDSLYVSALEDITESIRLSDNFKVSDDASEDKENVPTEKKADEPKSPCKRTPDGVEDYDLANWNDPFQVSHYAHDIFTYLKSREQNFIIPDYMDKQKHISKWMRALLVDWMVEIQESFELNHETLYLAVKIVDIYLSRAQVHKEDLQLLGATALLIASKYDERVPPTVDDYNYICDGAYNRREILLMEMKVLMTIDYDLSIPLSYRFLRRYARVNRISMQVLTLARYILEYSLMDYSTVSLSDSKLACAALFIAIRMTSSDGWNKTLEFYTGYKIEDFADIAILLNTIMLRKPKEALNTVRQKYSHELFFETAKMKFIPTLPQLFENTDYQPKPHQIQAMKAMLTASSTTPTPATAESSKTVAQTAV